MIDEIETTEIIDEELEALKATAKELNIPRYMLMKKAKLIEKIAELKKEPEEDNKIVISDSAKKELSALEFDTKWLPPIMNKYGFESMAYVTKFKAFRCFIDNAPVDWIDINELSLLNGGRKLIKILTKHTPVSKNKHYPNRGIIHTPWR